MTTIPREACRKICPLGHCQAQENARIARRHMPDKSKEARREMAEKIAHGQDVDKCPYRRVTKKDLKPR